MAKRSVFGYPVFLFTKDKHEYLPLSQQKTGGSGLLGRSVRYSIFGHLVLSDISTIGRKIRTFLHQLTKKHLEFLRLCTLFLFFLYFVTQPTTLMLM